VVVFGPTPANRNEIHDEVQYTIISGNDNILTQDEAIAQVRIILNKEFRGSRNSSVGIETSYWLEGRGSIPSRGKRFLFTVFKPALGAHPAS
jgi:hypothetical protein